MQLLRVYSSPLKRVNVETQVDPYGVYSHASNWLYGGHICFFFFIYCTKHHGASVYKTNTPIIDLVYMWSFYHLCWTSRQHWREQVNSTLIEFHLSETSRLCRVRTWTAGLTDREVDHCAISPPLIGTLENIQNIVFYDWHHHLRIWYLLCYTRLLDICRQ